MSNYCEQPSGKPEYNIVSMRELLTQLADQALLDGDRELCTMFIERIYFMLEEPLAIAPL